MSDITVTSETYGTLCICAVRYALGRQTYMPDEVATAVLQALDKLPDNDLMVLLRDIKAYLLKPNGDVNDKVWYKLGNRLFDEMDRRNEQRQRVAPDDHQDYTDTPEEWAGRAVVRDCRIPNETKPPESLLSEGAHTVKESRDTLYAINMHPDPDTGLVDCGCGGSAGAWEQQTRKGVKHYVECESCEISTADYDTPQAAITAWNTAMGGEGRHEHDADR